MGQIMDPKMDSGCVAPGEEFEETYDVSRSLLPEEVLGIIDELICHEVWLSSVPFCSLPQLTPALFRCHGISDTLFPRPSSPASTLKLSCSLIRAASRKQRL